MIWLLKKKTESLDNTLFMTDEMQIFEAIPKKKSGFQTIDFEDNSHFD